MTDALHPEPTPARPPESPDGLSLALNFLPLLQLAAGLCLASTGDSLGGALGLLAAWVYLLPPAVSRLTLALWGRPQGRLEQGSRGFRVWWFLSQWQMVFNRLPQLEELLRLMPGIYAMWIAGWGGRLSPQAFVSPGVIFTDRYLVDVGRGAVLGMKSALVGHLAVRDEDGRFVVIVGAPVVEPDAVLGGDAGLGPGAVLRAGQMLPAGQRVAPGGEWPRRRAPEARP